MEKYLSLETVNFITFHYQEKEKEKKTNVWTNWKCYYSGTTKFWHWWRAKSTENWAWRRQNYKYTKKHKYARYRLSLLEFLFPASVKNNTEQIFVTCRELNDIKKILINSKIYWLLGIIDLNKINNWKEIIGVKGQSIWINTTLEEQKKLKWKKTYLLSVYYIISEWPVKFQY